MAEKPVAVLALFPSPGALLEAIPRIRERRLGKLQAYTPYPVHGLSDALELPPSPLGKMVFVMGFLGAVLALLFQWWTSAVDYPVRIGGKAFFSWQAFVPIVFEVTVLFAAFTAGLGMILLLNRLPWFGHPVLASEAITSITRDRFALAIETGEPLLDVDAARAALLEVGGQNVEVLYGAAEPADPGRVLGVKETLGIAVACIVAGIGTYHAIKLFPVLPPMNEMDVQRKVLAYQGRADSPGMRSPAPGSIARGHLPLPVAEAEEAGALLANPLPRTEAVFARGRTAYQTFCQVCHGALGEGNASLSEAYRAAPTSLQSSTVMDYPDGRIFYVITKGKGSMPSYAAELSPDNRWAAVHYVRALQRSLHAEPEDLP